jgi:UDP-glucuronate decarboxylase
LDWSPQVDIEAGLMRTIAYFRDLDLSKFKRPTNNTAHRQSEIANQAKAAGRD